MKIISRPCKITFFVSLFVSFFCAPIVMAEDVEIYVGKKDLVSDIKPNLVFIIDTSGSMNTDVEVQNGTYDPATTYTGSCASDRVYWKTTGDVPGCGTSRYFAASSNKCAASSASLGSGGSGFHVTRAARYKPRSNEDRWVDLSNNDHDDYVECQEDFGVHGLSDASTAKYPADENDGGPWRSNDTGAINWNNTGRTYTFYSGNYLNWRNGTGAVVTQTRLSIVQNVFSDLMDSINNVNLAVMRFDNKSQSANQGGYFVMPMQELTADNRDSYKTAVNNFTSGGYTPLAETLYESYLFYKGAAVKYGDDTDPGTNVAGVLDTTDTTKYKSPVEYQCQKNFVILLTDGAPTYDTSADNDIEGMPGFSAATGAASCSGNCLDELADYMHTKDCSSLDGTQNVITYTIGFNTDQTLLSNAATKGGGKYYTADDPTGLIDVLLNIVTDITETNTSFIAPAVSVNAFNRFTHRDELYYALFRPDIHPIWNGNVKRYQLYGSPPEIVDVNQTLAIDVNTGFFKETAASYWTPLADSPDGKVIKDGGAASMLALPRTLYTYTGVTAASDENLTVSTNALHEDNTLITKTMLGNVDMTDTDQTNILKWTRGVDLLDSNSDGDSTDVRRLMADPLHTKPTLITYGGTEASPDITLFAGTNEGLLHAINTSTGEELFSFIPQEILPILPQLYADTGENHPYGLDGPLTSWVNDVNQNGILYTAGSLEAGEHVYLYQAMRRGGKNYYALNVTDRSTPTLKWVIKGGSGNFSELAQSWSAATKARIKLNGVDKTVLIFGGGYDVDQDDNLLALNDTEGRAVFMVDASTGVKIWQAGPSGSNDGSDPDLVLSDMTNSIPSDLNIIDMDFDGYADRMYVGDMRGQLWRFDIDNSNTGVSSLVTGGVIASLGGSTEADNRRFYYKPDVSLSDDGKHLNIAIGSGFRAHPLNTNNHDAFFVIQDKNVYAPAKDLSGNPVYTALTISDLFNATDNVIGEGTEAAVTTARNSLKSSDGFYIYMNEESGSFVGEKVLAKSVTLSGKVIFTTYTPTASASNACSPSQGTARAYYIDVTDGTPVIDTNASGGVPIREDRRIDLVRGGIPPEPSVIFHENGPVVLIGTEKGPDPELLLKPRKTHWYAE